MNIQRIPKKQFLLFGLMSLCILGIGWRFFGELSFRDSSIILTKGEPIKILPGETLTQTFIPKSGELKRLEFLVRNPEPKKGDRVIIMVADATCQNPIRESVLRPGYLDSDNLFIARFNPLTVSPNEPLCAILHFDDTTPQSPFLRFFTHESRPDTFLEFKLGGALQTDLALALRPVYIYPTLGQNLNELNNRISQYKPWFLKDGFLTFITSVFIVSTLALLLLLMFKKENLH